MKRGDLKPAYARWSSEEESVRVALLRPLVWTASFLETSLGKHWSSCVGIGSLSTSSLQRTSTSSRLTCDRARWSPDLGLADTLPSSVPLGNSC
jgi:hypothetical protein